MKKIAMFDTKPYDKVWFDRENKKYEIVYIESRLNHKTAKLAEGCDAVCAFVNDRIDAKTIDELDKMDIRLLAMRCAGYSNVDFEAAHHKVHVVRVPAYSPYAVAEHTMALLLTLNRKTNKAYNRTRDFNFSLNGLTGTVLHNKTVGVIGTGKIGQCFINICKGFGMEVLAYDPYPVEGLGVEYVEMDELLKRSDIISLHCPLTKDTEYILSKEAFSKMKKGVYIINTSRGGLVDTDALIDALNDKTVAGAGLDVYEEEAAFFFEDRSDKIMSDDRLALLVSKPNVLLTAHQAFLAEEALESIAKTTLSNIEAYLEKGELKNQVVYTTKEKKIIEKHD
jgi:D-lactate dehydrogenase